jgi:hypothetical protein
MFLEREQAATGSGIPDAVRLGDGCGDGVHDAPSLFALTQWLQRHGVNA